MEHRERRQRILLVDDDRVGRGALAALLRRHCYRVTTAGDGYLGLGSIAEDGCPDLVLADLRMPGMDGVTLLRRLHDIEPALPVIVFTADPSIQSAIEATRAGATDYLTKPLEPRQLLARMERVLALAAPAARPLAVFGELVAASVPMLGVLQAARREAATDMPVYIEGEPGTGRHSLARAIHAESGRGELVWATAERAPERGQLPSEATLVIPCLERLEPSEQFRLLDLLMAGRPPRVIALGAPDTCRAWQEGRLLPGLWFHLSALELRLPPLRARREEIVPIALAKLGRLAQTRSHAPDRLAEDAIAALQAHEWPGNVRELENVIRRAADRSCCDTIYARDLALDPVRTAPPIPGSTLEEIERHAILSTLEMVGGNKREAARILGISTRKIQYRLHDYGAPSTSKQGDGDGRFDRAALARSSSEFASS